MRAIAFFVVVWCIVIAVVVMAAVCVPVVILAVAFFIAIIWNKQPPIETPGPSAAEPPGPTL